MFSQLLEKYVLYMYKDDEIIYSLIGSNISVEYVQYLL